MTNGLWIMLFIDLPDHRKVYDFAERLDIDEVTALGHIALLWCGTKRHADDGDITKVTPRAIANWCKWRGGRDVLYQAFIDAGIIDQRPDGSVHIHGWMDVNRKAYTQKQDINLGQELGKPHNRGIRELIIKRDRNRCRFCAKKLPIGSADRRSDDRSTYVRLDPHGPITAPNVVQGCGSCHDAHVGYTLEESGLTLLPEAKTETKPETARTPSPGPRSESSSKPSSNPEKSVKNQAEGEGEGERYSSVRSDSAHARVASDEEVAEIMAALRFPGEDQGVADDLHRIAARFPQLDLLTTTKEYVKWQLSLPSSKQHDDWLAGLERNAEFQDNKGKYRRRASNIRVLRPKGLELPVTSSAAWNQALDFLRSFNKDAIALAQQENKTSWFERVILSPEVTEANNRITLAAPSAALRDELIAADPVIRQAMALAQVDYLSIEYTAADAARYAV